MISRFPRGIHRMCSVQRERTASRICDHDFRRFCLLYTSRMGEIDIAESAVFGRCSGDVEAVAERGEGGALAGAARGALSLLACRAGISPAGSCGRTCRASAGQPPTRRHSFSAASRARAARRLVSSGSQPHRFWRWWGRCCPCHCPRGGKMAHNGKYLANGRKSRCSR